MFCVQCEHTIRTPANNGCSFAKGMCGKTAEVSDLQDVLVHILQGISHYATLARPHGIVDADADAYVPQAFFATLTNVNFDPERILAFTRTAETLRERLKAKLEAKNITVPDENSPARFTVPADKLALLAKAPLTQLNRNHAAIGDDILGLRLLCLYGLKGVAAYMEHARVLGQTDAEVAGEFHAIMALLGDEPTAMDALLATAMRIGHLNYRVMAMLDLGETDTFGHPEPTRVNLAPVAGQAILVSGHDLLDLESILIQTASTGINVFTHGEMLPAHAYPALKRHPHLVGHYGTGWQNQQREFAAFPGAIVMTSNCIIDPAVGQYGDRIFTRSIVGWPGVTHIEGEDFSAVIAKARALKGFPTTDTPRHTTTGFARNALMAAAPAVIEQVKAGHIKHFFLIGGCDGDKRERSYYTELAQAVPQDSVILSLACGKFRFNALEFGDINGIPRYLDVGQCNDAYSAIQLALALAESFECGVNDLPLSLVLSWFEQKAIAILLTLLALGVKNIRVGPTAPAFLTPNLLAYLKDNFGLTLISTVEQDLRDILQAA